MTPITISNLQKFINAKPIIKVANFDVAEGEICALIGPNGVGKTTLLKCLLGLVKPDQGTIKINDTILTETTRPEILKAIGTVFQFPPNISDMTISELLNQHFNYLKLDMPDSYVQLLKVTELDVPLTTKVGKLSLGMKRRLQLTMALAHQPKILILDEPFNGLDIDGINLIKNILTDLRKKDICIMVTSHSLSELEEFVSSVVFMLNGETCEKQYLEHIKKEYAGGLQAYYQIKKEEFKNEKKL